MLAGTKTSPSSSLLLAGVAAAAAFLYLLPKVSCQKNRLDGRKCYILFAVTLALLGSAFLPSVGCMVDN